jgi:hypothetical protein
MPLNGGKEIELAMFKTIFLLKYSNLLVKLLLRFKTLCSFIDCELMAFALSFLSKNC